MTADPALGEGDSVPEEVTVESVLCIKEESHSTLGTSWGMGIRWRERPQSQNLQGFVDCAQGFWEPMAGAAASRIDICAIYITLGKDWHGEDWK